MDSLFESYSAKYEHHECASSFNFDKFPSVLINNNLHTCLHKFQICDGKNKGYYLVLLPVQSVEHIDNISKMLHHIPVSEAKSLFEFGLHILFEYPLIYLRWSVNTWKFIDLKLNKKQITDYIPKKDSSVTIQRALQSLKPA